MVKAEGCCECTPSRESCEEGRSTSQNINVGSCMQTVSLRCSYLSCESKQLWFMVEIEVENATCKPSTMQQEGLCILFTPSMFVFTLHTVDVGVRSYWSVVEVRASKACTTSRRILSMTKRPPAYHCQQLMIYHLHVYVSCSATFSLFSAAAP